MSLDDQNTKVRAQRIRLDYLRRRGWLDRWKIGLVLVAFAIAAAYVVWSTVGIGAVRQFSPGTLAFDHAILDQKCAACHIQFSPTSAAAWTDNPHASDRSCWECHRVTKHATNQIAEEVVSCAACHTDHHGRRADLTAVADSECINCHKDIDQHHDPKLPLAIKNLKPVTSDFATDHPEFDMQRTPRKDPGPLKFSHIWHLMPGLPFGNGPYRLSDLSPEDRERYRHGASDDALITLECADCHQLARKPDSRGSANGADMPQLTAAGPAIGAGDYMLPVSYELHCRACHPLSYSGTTEPAVATPSNRETERFVAKPGETVPHGWSDAQLRKYLAQVVSAQLVNLPDANVRGKPLPYAVKNQAPPNSPLPYKSVQQHPQADTIGKYLDEELNDRVAVLRKECLLCHAEKSTLGAAAKPSETLDVEPLFLSHRWLEQSKFNHTAHQQLKQLKCNSCHVFDFPTELPKSPTILAMNDSAEQLIPKKAVCLECHRPAQGSGHDAQGGARYGCVECHRYHDSQQPWFDEQPVRTPLATQPVRPAE